MLRSKNFMAFVTFFNIQNIFKMLNSCSLKLIQLIRNRCSYYRWLWLMASQQLLVLCPLPSPQNWPCWCKFHSIRGCYSPAPMPPHLSESGWNHKASRADCHHLHGNSAGCPLCILHTTCCQWCWAAHAESIEYSRWLEQKICGERETLEHCLRRPAPRCPRWFSFPSRTPCGNGPTGAHAQPNLWLAGRQGWCDGLTLAIGSVVTRRCHCRHSFGCNLCEWQPVKPVQFVLCLHSLPGCVPLVAQRRTIIRPTNKSV